MNLKRRNNTLMSRRYRLRSGLEQRSRDFLQLRVAGTRWSQRGCGKFCRWWILNNFVGSSPSQRHVKQPLVCLSWSSISICYRLLHGVSTPNPLGYVEGRIAPRRKIVFFLNKNRVTSPTCQPIKMCLCIRTRHPYYSICGILPSWVNKSKSGCLPRAPV